jgi:hypothetical protein
VVGERLLTIDHRVPYRIAGEASVADRNVDNFMLLDGSSQRSKSWSCEHCPNWNIGDPEVCRTCFWAYPDDYQHIATAQIRRTDVIWQGDDVAVYDRLKVEAAAQGETVASLLLSLARQRGRTR